jgi:hypothetical protein
MMRSSAMMPNWSFSSKIRFPLASMMSIFQTTVFHSEIQRRQHFAASLLTKQTVVVHDAPYRENQTW